MAKRGRSRKRLAGDLMGISTYIEREKTLQNSPTLKSEYNASFNVYLSVAEPLPSSLYAPFSLRIFTL